MTVITKTHALRVIRRAYGPDHAESLAQRLPDRLDLDNPADTKLLFELGLRSWLSDDASNKAMRVDQVRPAIGDRAIDDLAQLTGGSPSAVAWQLAAVLPDLVDAASPGGEVVDASRLAREIAEASAYDDLSAGAFGSHLH